MLTTKNLMMKNLVNFDGITLTLILENALISFLHSLLVITSFISLPALFACISSLCTLYRRIFQAYAYTCSLFLLPNLSFIFEPLNATLGA
jgi:Na+-translocating ferredoxin:NAD+ oxidoreductase RnfE subunit